MLLTLAHLIGGLGLLLFGMALMTDGLKLASGKALRNVLALWTNTRLRALFSGFLVTAIVQSSSAVTLATIGFANAGMLSLQQGIWAIFGSNVGTTMTAWIVALVGFRMDIEALALPLVGLGVLLRLSAGRSRRAHVGAALVGFGLLFLGIGVLKGAFESLAGAFTLPESEVMNLSATGLYVLAGFALTSLVQSSSAAMVIALGAAQSGLVSLPAAAAVVIGANLGTTSTALLALWGATSTAKRVALGHVAFNALTALVAVFILNPLLRFAVEVESFFSLETTSATTLAIFHSLFNVLGVLLMWPISGALVGFLQRRFTTREESESQPRYLDRTVLGLPFLAADAMALEVTRINSQAVRAVRLALSPGPCSRQGLEESRVVRKLARAVGDYAVELTRAQLTPFLSQVVANLMESMQQYMLAVNIAEDIDGFEEPEEGFRPPVAAALAALNRAVNTHLDCQDLSIPAFPESESASYDEVERSYRELKLEILRQASAGQFTMEEVDGLLQYANQVKRACRQLYKATRRLVAVRDELQRDAAGNVVAGGQAPAGTAAGSMEKPVTERAEEAEADEAVSPPAGEDEHPEGLEDSKTS